MAALGYEMVLGNTFHLFLDPGPSTSRDLGGLHEFMALAPADHHRLGRLPGVLARPRHVADEIKRRRGNDQSWCFRISEEGVRFRSYIDGCERFMGPETSMEVQAALGSDVALAFDECTPSHADRDYTPRQCERTHRWLDRCVAWRREHPPPSRCSWASSRAAYTRTCAHESAERVAAAARGRRGHRWLAGRAKEPQMRAVVGWSLRALPDEAAAPPAGHRRRGRHPQRGRAPASTPSTAPRPPGSPPRHGAGARPGAALPARPRQGAVAPAHASRSPRAARAPPAASTRAATSTT